MGGNITGHAASKDGQIDIYLYAVRRRTVFYLHNICWNALEELPCLKRLYSLGLATTPVLRMGSLQNIHADQGTLANALEGLPETDTGLSAFLRRVKNLPFELTSMIWEFLSPCVTRCLLSVRALNLLLQQIVPIPVSSDTVYFHGDITFYTRRVLGGSYICGIRSDSTGQLFGFENQYSQRISISTPVTAVIFIVGLYGLQGIKYYLKDGGKGSVGVVTTMKPCIGCTSIISPRSYPLCLNLECVVSSSALPPETHPDKITRGSKSAASAVKHQSPQFLETTSYGTGPCLFSF